MIELDHITKAYWYRGIPKYIAKDVSAVIPNGAKLALMGRNGAGKSTLLAMIAGGINPNRGRIRSTGSLSWPIGLTGTIQGDLTGIHFLAQLEDASNGSNRAGLPAQSRQLAQAIDGFDPGAVGSHEVL